MSGFLSEKRMRVLYLLIILFGVSCRPNRENESFIRIKIENSIEVDNFSFAYEALYIPLEFCDNCIIGDISKILKVKEGYIISDKEYSKQIYKFDNDGNFLFKIGESGEGLGNYILPFDFSLIPNTNRIVVFDKNQSKMIYFDTNNGEFIEERKVYFQPESAYFLDSTRIAIHLDGNFSGDVMEYLGVILDLDSNEFVVRNVWDFAKTDHYKPYGDFYLGTDGLLFAKALNDTIYYVNSGGFHPKYLIDFGDDAVPEFLKNMPMPEIYEKMNALLPSYHNGNFIENDKYLFYLWWGSDDKGKFSYFDKIKSKNYVFDEGQVLFKHPFYLDNKTMYSFLNNRDLEILDESIDYPKFENHAILKVVFRD